MDKPLKIKKRRASLDARKARSGYFFVAPFIIGIILIYLPILIDSVWFSITTIDRSNFQAGDVYVVQGFRYYIEAFANTTFTSKLLDGIQEVIFQVPAIIIFSLFIAVVLNQKMLGRALFRAIFFVPVILSTGLMETLNASTQGATDAAQGGIQDGSGEGSAASGIISIMDVQSLFESVDIAKPIVEYVVKIVNDVYNIINYSGVQMLIFLAGLQSISPAIYEASQIEGATGWETFWKITFPMISPMILVNSIYTVIDSFTRSTNPAMSWIAGLYNGDPHNATAMSWMYFLVVMLIIVVVAGILSSFIFYQRRD
jgi:ABC-type sugar transport system permease subunit